jgi:hypothetical protein
MLITDALPVMIEHAGSGVGGGFYTLASLPYHLFFGLAYVV